MRHGRPMTLDFARLLSGPWLVKYMVPRHEGHYVLYPGFVPWISRAALRFRRLDLPMRREHAVETFVPWLTFGRVYRSLGCDIR